MIYRKMLKSKIHRATITEACLDYEGSITIPPELLIASNILMNECVSVWNVTSGSRFDTYAIEGEPESTNICVNGAAAHLVTPGDLVIIASFIQLTDESCYSFKPTVVFVDEHNRIKEVRPEMVNLKRSSTSL
jgi:aspartate 1-decarboxylase